jgi:hypothetical protein
MNIRLAHVLVDDCVSVSCSTKMRVILHLTVCRFYGGLRCEIQDIVDYKEFTTTNQLFQLAMLAGKEL